MTLGLGVGRAQAQDGGIMIGAVAPDAAVETLEGKSVRLASYFSGKPVVLEFWATWCPLCKKLEAPLEAARTKYAGKVTFVSVGVRDNQTPARQKAYAESQRLSGEFVFDKDGNAVAAYMAPHTSFLVVIDAGGKVVYTGVGADQDIEAAIATAFTMRDGMRRGAN
jgi:thiol-disulfide isomerase/thioredoxin